jgi:HD-GYP domain-containing protein (c-di-GMP phosphodiesterase class II)
VRQHDRMRLAELTVALSLATDLGTGQPLEHGLRTCLLSLRTAAALGVEARMESCVYYTALLRFVGCTSDATDTAVLAGGDDIAFNAVMAPMLMAQPGEGMRYFVRHLAQELPATRRIDRVVTALADPAASGRSLAQHCEVGARLASRLGLGDPVVRSLAHAYERWDGRGDPAGLAGEEVPLAVRIVTVARDAELWHRLAGWSAAAKILRRRRGHSYDPDVVDVFLAGGQRWLTELPDDCRTAVLDAEPAPVATLPVDGLNGALAAVADFTDLKSPWLRGHSTGVADLVSAAAEIANLPDSAATTLRQAALVHDVGRVGVPNGIWDHPGRLTTEQWERVRLHPYLTERVMRRCTPLVEVADLASRHHERVDGSGYHRGCTVKELDLNARLLAAADAYQAMTQDRPHRPALSAGSAGSALVKGSRAGLYDNDAVDAVLAAAGQGNTRQSKAVHPAGLSDREVQVLRLIARGRANKQVAAALGISPKTVGRHVEHVYGKAEVSTRAGATLFAMEHGLLTP